MELSIEQISKHFGSKSAVNNISVSFQPGLYGLLGANGAGKTTLMRMICDILKPTPGRILYDGKEIENLGEDYRNLLGYLPQDFGYYPDFTAKEYLDFIAAIKGINGTKAKKKVVQLLETVNLSNVAGKKIRTFSGGMKQRLGIAAAIMHEPELLILDEPINGLDPIGIVEIRSFLSELSHNHGITIFISSHVLSEIEQIADIIGVMHEGHLVEEVNISELHKRNRKYIQFDLSDSEIAGKILENHYHMTDFTVQDGTVRIYDFSQSVGEINREFARNGLLVTRINDSEENLEDYFSKLIGGGGIA